MILFNARGKRQKVWEKFSGTETAPKTCRCSAFNYLYDISHMTPVALLQDKAGAGPNESTSSQFLELG